MLAARVTLAVWPDSAVKRAQQHTAAALGAIGDLVEDVVTGAMTSDETEEAKSRRVFHTRIEEARVALEGIRFGDGKAMRKRVEAVDRLYSSAIIIRRVAEETDEVLQGEAFLVSLVSTIREKACQVIQQMASGSQPAREQLKLIESAIHDARDFVANSGQSPDVHLRQSAMIFGLKEIMEQLEDTAPSIE